MNEETIIKPKKPIRNYEDIFQDATALLIKNHTFFGHILAHMVRISTTDVMTMGVSVNEKGQILLYYNPEMIRREIEDNGSTLKQVTAMVQHEVYHVINEHFLREIYGKFDAWIITTLGPMRLFNVAGDLSINQFIDNLPKWVLQIDMFKGMELPKEEHAELYYGLLLKQAKKNAEKLREKLKDLGDASGVIIFEKGENSPSMTGIPMPGGSCPTCGGSGTVDRDSKGSKKSSNESGSSSDQGGKEQCPDCGGTGHEKDGKEKDIDKINDWLPFNKKAFEDWLREQMKQGTAPTSKQTGMPGDHGKWQETKKIPREMVDVAIKHAIKEAYNRAKFGGQGIGSLPAGIERMCKETLKPAYNFEPFLRKFVDGEIFNKFEQTRKRPNRRYRWDYPGKKTETMGKIGILADTSGSIEEEDISLFAKNLENISEYVAVVLFDVDTQINNIREYSKRNFDKMLKGGGGTDFGDVFKILDDYGKNKRLLGGIPTKQLDRAKTMLAGIQALIIMTDGQAMGVPAKEPRKISTLWALTKKCHKPPVKWGKVIYLDNKPESHERR